MSEAVGFFLHVILHINSLSRGLTSPQTILMPTTFLV